MKGKIYEYNAEGRRKVIGRIIRGDWTKMKVNLAEIESKIKWKCKWN